MVYMRLLFASKPDPPLPGGRDRTRAFEEAVNRYRKLDLPLGINLTTGPLRALIAQPQ